VLLLDCSYGGAFRRGVSVKTAGDVSVLDSFPAGKLAGARGRAVITASTAMEYAFEGEQLAPDSHPAPSLFTSALVRGLVTGEADLDQDGLVSLNELYDYVFDQVHAQNPNQTPSRDIEMLGELYLARSGRRKVRPASTPPDPEAAATQDLLPVSPRSARQPSGSASQPTALLATIDKAVREVVTEGRVVFNAATTMRQGHRGRVEVAIARSTELDQELLASLQSTTNARLETIPTSPFMGVNLGGAGFEITALTNREQLLRQTAQWEFDVLPRRSGTRRLQVSITMRIPSLTVPMRRSLFPSWSAACA